MVMSLLWCFGNLSSGSVKCSLAGGAKAAHCSTEFTGISLRKSYQMELKALTFWGHTLAYTLGVGGPRLPTH